MAIVQKRPNALREDEAGQNTDNFKIKVVSYGRPQFELAFHLAFMTTYCRTATAWAKHPEKGLIFLRYIGGDDKDCHPFPVPIGSKEAAGLAWNWLVNEAEYPEEPDHDGSNSMGWEVYNEDWCRVADYDGAILAVLPAWMMHGK